MSTIPSTSDVRIVSCAPITPPIALRTALPLDDGGARRVMAWRTAVQNCIAGRDLRPLVIVGPCSIHDPAAAREYAGRLKELADRLADRMQIVMRVYFEKPRTTVGWKGLINDPHLDDSYDIEAGLHLARALLRDLVALGLPAATEFLDPIAPQYLADLVTWAAIGARTTESQTHREMASGLSMPVGFKNGTDGGLDVALNALVSAGSPHRFLGIDPGGAVSVVHTMGNPFSHLVLRGGTNPNYDAASVAQATARLKKAGLRERLMVDCSHGNSGKDHRRQPGVLADVGQQLGSGCQTILGVMIESHLQEGRQELGRSLVYGQSITDACVGWDTTVSMLTAFAGALPVRGVA